MRNAPDIRVPPAFRRMDPSAWQPMSDEGLVQFLVLGKTAKGAACVALIQQVLSNRKIFVFGELLALPNVQAVRTDNTTRQVLE